MGTKVKNDLASVVLGDDEAPAKEAAPAAAESVVVVTDYVPEEPEVEAPRKLSEQTLREIEMGKATLLRKQQGK